MIGRLDIYRQLSSTPSVLTFRTDGDGLIAMSSSRALFSGEPSVGGCYCGELKVDIYPYANGRAVSPNGRYDYAASFSIIPRNAKLVPYLSDDDGQTWVKKSEFYVFKREVDPDTGVISIQAYDTIYNSERSFIQLGFQDHWPQTARNVMMEIARRTNSSVYTPSLTLMDAYEYDIPFPGVEVTIKGNPFDEDAMDAANWETVKVNDEPNSLTMRELAGRIAAMYGGNWVINDNGEWELLLLGDIPAETHYLVTEYGEAILIGGDRILV